jgi:hypothetical protein
MFRSPTKMTKLEVEIDKQLTKLKEATDPKEYDEILARIEKLHKMKEKRNTVSADTWALIGANILGIVIIITHEYTHPVTTKALNLAMKPGRVKP